MSKIITISNDDLATEELVSIVTPFSVSMLDTRSELIPDDLKKNMLHEKFKNRIISDGIETGQISVVEGGFSFNSRQSFSSFAGFVFEAYLVDTFSRNRTSRLRAYEWCTERAEGWSKKDFDDYIAVGTGLLETKTKYYEYYQPQSSADIIFLRENKRLNIIEQAMIHNQLRFAAIQVKSIKSKFKEEIVNNILNGKYKKVITMLSDSDGRPSWVICHNIVKNMYRKKDITSEQCSLLLDAIQGPEYFNLDQRYIDDYYEYIVQWSKGREFSTEYITDAVHQEVASYKYEKGILVPL